ncbi:MAG: hypothetical protein AAF850_10890, partial [Pseudomonadota bacterium]
MSASPILAQKLCAVAIVLCIFQAHGAAAQNTNERDIRVIERRLIQRAAEESRLENEAAEREQELEALRAQMIDAAETLQSAEQRIGDIGLEIQRLNDEERAITQSLRSQQDRLGDVLGALLNLERSQPPALLVSPDDVNQAARAAMVLSDAAPTLEREAASLRASLQELADVKQALSDERAEYERVNTDILARRRVLADLVEKKRAERDVAASLAAAAQRETAALAARATSLREILARLKRFARRITPRLKPPISEPDQSLLARAPSRKPLDEASRFQPRQRFDRARGRLSAPVAGNLVGQFGAQRPEGGRFDGVRFIAENNAIVTTPFQADVVFARSWEPIGNLIVLDVGEGYHILLIGV